MLSPIKLSHYWRKRNFATVDATRVRINATAVLFVSETSRQLVDVILDLSPPKSIDLNSANSLDKITPTMMAALRGMTAVVERFLSATTRSSSAIAAAVNPNLFDQHGRTAMWMAAANGRTEVVRLLLENGAVAWCPDSRRKINPLMFAVERRNLEMARVLVRPACRVELCYGDAIQHPCPMHTMDLQLQVILLGYSIITSIQRHY